MGPLWDRPTEDGALAGVFRDMDTWPHNYFFNQIIEFSKEVFCGHQITSALGGDYKMPVLIHGDLVF